MTKSPKEIKEILALDLKERGITHQYIANLTNLSKGTISNALAGDKPFSRGIAVRISQVLGYNIQFLLTGDGDLRRKDAPLPKIENKKGDEKLLALYPALNVCLLDILESVLYIMGELTATKISSYLNQGNYQGVDSIISDLETRYGKRVPRASAFTYCEMARAVMPAYTEMKQTKEGQE